MTFEQKLAVVQFLVMALAGFFAWWTARANKQYERDRGELLERIERLEDRLDRHLENQ